MLKINKHYLKLNKMKASELRIGNYVYINNTENWKELINVPMEVKGISFNREPFDRVFETVTAKRLYEEKYDINTDYCQYAQFIDPIPLTTEWLIKLGFSKKTISTYCNKDRKIIFEDVLEFNIFEYSISGRTIYLVLNYIHHTIDIKYVHELQNLYFALTRKELKIK